MKKKIVVCFILISLMVTFFNFFAYAETERKANVNFAFNKTSVEVGESIEIIFSTSDWVNVDGGIAGFQFEFYFDTDKFTEAVTQVEPNIGISTTQFAQVHIKNPSEYRYLCYDASLNNSVKILKAGNLFKVTFSAKDTTPTGNYDFSLVGGNMIRVGDVSDIKAIYPPKATLHINNPKISAVSSTVSVVSNPLASSSEVPVNSISSTFSTSSISLVSATTAEQVVQNIDMLPDVITPETKSYVAEVKKQYDKLPESEKYKVGNIDDLLLAESQVATMAEPIKKNSSILKIILGMVGVLLILGIAALYFLKLRKPKEL